MPSTNLETEEDLINDHSPEEAEEYDEDEEPGEESEPWKNYYEKD